MAYGIGREDQLNRLNICTHPRKNDDAKENRNGASNNIENNPASLVRNLQYNWIGRLTLQDLCLLTHLNLSWTRSMHWFRQNH